MLSVHKRKSGKLLTAVSTTDHFINDLLQQLLAALVGTQRFRVTTSLTHSSVFPVVAMADAVAILILVAANGFIADIIACATLTRDPDLWSISPSARSGVADTAGSVLQLRWATRSA